MLAYVLRRIVYVVPIVISVALVCFLLVHITPGDPLVAVLPADASQELAAQMRTAYMVGREEPLKLLLNQRDPARAGRMFAYYSYFGRARAEQIVAGCAEASATLRELQALPFLAEVHALLAFRGATPLLQRDAHYREVYRMWQALRQQPQFAFDSPLFATPIADLPRLYESWCAIQVAEALLTLGGELRAQHLIEVRQPRDDALEHVVALSERAPLLEVTRGEWTITLRYQPRYRPARGEARAEDAAEAGGARRQAPGAAGLGSLDRYTHVPDLAIELRAAGQPPQAIILDAKYRVEADGQRVPQDALADAYTYLGAIGREGRRASLTALLLYPGAGLPEEYSSGVGAIPLLPGYTAHLAAAIGRWLPG